MNTRSLVNLCLALAVALAAALVYFQPKPSAPARYALLPKESHPIERIEIHRRGFEPILLAREQGQWHMQRPFAGRVNDLALARILEMGQLQSEQRMPAGALERFELDRPWARIDFSNHTLAFGMHNDVTGELYVRSGDFVYSVPARIAGHVPGEASKLLSLRLLAPEEKPVAFRLGAFSLRQQDGRWQSALADSGWSQDDLVRWVEHWRMASSLVTQPATGHAAGERVEIDLRDGRTIVLHATARSPYLILRREDEGVEYQLPARMADVLLAPPQAASTTR